MLVLGVAAIVGLNIWTAAERGDWWTAASTIAAVAAVAALLLVVYVRFRRRELHDPRFVQDKLRREAWREARVSRRRYRGDDSRGSDWARGRRG